MQVENMTYDGKKVGQVLNSLVYVTFRKQSKHLFRGGEKDVRTAKRKGKAAWGIDHDLLYLLKHKGLRVVAVADTETGKVYWAMLGTWLKSGDFMDLKHGLQRFLKLDRLQVTESLDGLVKATEGVLKGMGGK